MARSSQKFIAKNRAPRVQIEYDVEVYGSEKKIQLPFVMGVMSDLSGKPAEVGLIKEIIKANPPAGVCGALLAMASRTDTTPALPNIKVPTLILVGEKDLLAPPAASEAMRKLIPGAELHVIPGAGHLSSLENPAEFNRRLLDFLKKV